MLSNKLGLYEILELTWGEIVNVFFLLFKGSFILSCINRVIDVQKVKLKKAQIIILFYKMTFSLYLSPFLFRMFFIFCTVSPKNSLRSWDFDSYLSPVT